MIPAGLLAQREQTQRLVDRGHRRFGAQNLTGGVQPLVIHVH
jgi:hypothetical protein